MGYLVPHAKDPRVPCYSLYRWRHPGSAKHDRSCGLGGLFFARPWQQPGGGGLYPDKKCEETCGSSARHGGLYSISDCLCYPIGRNCPKTCWRKAVTMLPVSRSSQPALRTSLFTTFAATKRVPPRKSGGTLFIIQSNYSLSKYRGYFPVSSFTRSLT